MQHQYINPNEYRLDNNVMLKANELDSQVKLRQKMIKNNPSQLALDLVDDQIKQLSEWLNIPVPISVPQQVSIPVQEVTAAPSYEPLSHQMAANTVQRHKPMVEPYFASDPSPAPMRPDFNRPKPLELPNGTGPQWPNQLITPQFKNKQLGAETFNNVFQAGQNLINHGVREFKQPGLYDDEANIIFRDNYGDPAFEEAKKIYMGQKGQGNFENEYLTPGEMLALEWRMDETTPEGFSNQYDQDTRQMQRDLNVDKSKLNIRYPALKTDQKNLLNTVAGFVTGSAGEVLQIPNSLSRGMLPAMNQPLVDQYNLGIASGVPKLQSLNQSLWDVRTDPLNYDILLGGVTGKMLGKSARFARKAIPDKLDNTLIQLRSDLIAKTYGLKKKFGDLGMVKQVKKTGNDMFGDNASAGFAKLLDEGVKFGSNLIDKSADQFMDNNALQFGHNVRDKIIGQDTQLLDNLGVGDNFGANVLANTIIDHPIGILKRRVFPDTPKVGVELVPINNFNVEFNYDSVLQGMRDKGLDVDAMRIEALKQINEGAAKLKKK